MDSGDLLLVAGEASGDLHGARLLEQLRKLGFDGGAFGMGGDELRAAGLSCIAHSSEVAVVGITEALKILPRARRIFVELLRQVDRQQPQAAVLIDFPDFNLRLAKALKRRGIPVIYYISPQVWAWRRGRVRTIRRVVEKMIVVFPFEVDFYRDHGIEATHVGHPLVDEVPQLAHAWDSGPDDGKPFHVTLLPGSRRSEVQVLLPILLAAGQRLAKKLPVRFSLIRASTISRRELEAELAKTGLAVSLVSERRFQALASSHLALCAAGTATLEVGLLGTPMIVTHRVTAASALVGRLLLRLPYVSLVNLVLQRDAVPELLQERADADEICREAVGLLADRERIRTMRSDLSLLRDRIGPAGASRRAAGEVLRYLPAG